MLIVAYFRDERFLERVPFQFELDPKLIEMDRLLDDPKLVLQVSNDLMRSSPQAAWNGRPSTPVEVTLRISVARRLMGWSYATTHDEIVGDVKWRWFCRIDDHSVPGHSAIQDREQLIQPATLHRLHDRVVHLARTHDVTTGKKFRGDSTVIETNIHFPTDSHLLSDSVRVLGRLCAAARQVLQPRTVMEKTYFRNRSRRAQRLARQIAQRLRGKQGQKNPKNWAKDSIANWSRSWKGFWRKSNGWKSTCDNAATNAPWRLPISWHSMCPWCVA
jgi:IS5 family transposase